LIEEYGNTLGQISALSKLVFIEFFFSALIKSLLQTMWWQKVPPETSVIICRTAQRYVREE
jgi:hypothetical protein